MSGSSIGTLPAFIEHRIESGGGSLYVREFAGSGPAFAVLHGFPDNGHIYDDLIPHLVSAGRRVIALDFLGFGASDKDDAAHYSFGQQLGDLETVVRVLDVDRVIPVGHDAGGPAAVNFALKHPERTHAVWPDERVLRRCARAAACRVSGVGGDEADMCPLATCGP